MPKCPRCKKMITRRAKNAILHISCPHIKGKWKVYYCKHCHTEFFGCGRCGYTGMRGAVYGD